MGALLKSELGVGTYNWVAPAEFNNPFPWGDSRGKLIIRWSSAVESFDVLLFVCLRFVFLPPARKKKGG